MFVILVAVILSGCAETSIGKYKHPCRVTGVTINVMSDRDAENYCEMGLEVRRNDYGAVSVPGSDVKVKGCIKGKEIVTTDNVDVLLHELRHLFDFNCQ